LRVFLIVGIFCLLVVGLQVMATTNPTPNNWGVHHYAFLSRAWLAAGAIGALFFFLVFALKIPSSLEGRISAPVAGVGIAAVGAVLFWIGRAQTAYLGDGTFWIESLRQGRLEGRTNTCL